MDVDGGLEILDGFRAAGVPAVSALMDLDAYDTWGRFGISSRAWTRRRQGRRLPDQHDEGVPDNTASGPGRPSRSPTWRSLRVLRRT
jgi:hypothetical protein